MMTTKSTYNYSAEKIHDLLSIDDNDTLLLEALDIEPDARCACPIHGGDNESAFNYVSTTRKWKCFTAQCDRKFGSDLIGLVKGIKNCGFQDACAFILKVINHEGDISISRIDLERKKFIKEKLIKAGDDYKEIIFDKKITDIDNSVEYFLKDRHFKLDTLKRFGAFFCNDISKSLYGRACIPLINDSNEIIGFTGRKTKVIDGADQNPMIRKWMHAPKNIRTGNHLFGINLAKDAIKDSHVAILVEGPLDCMRLHEAGIHNTVATLGTNFTERQRKLLLKYEVRSLILLYDPDRGGDEGVQSIVEKGRLYFNLYDLRSFLDNDPGDLTIEKINDTIKVEIEKIIQSEKNQYE